jgi:hypothetical protein
MPSVPELLIKVNVTPYFGTIWRFELAGQADVSNLGGTEQSQ